MFLFALSSNIKMVSWEWENGEMEWWSAGGRNSLQCNAQMQCRHQRRTNWARAPILTSPSCIKAVDFESNTRDVIFICLFYNKSRVGMRSFSFLYFTAISIFIWNRSEVFFMHSRILGKALIDHLSYYFIE